MAISIKMKYSDMDVSVELTHGVDYEVNSIGFLDKLEDLLNHLSLYEDVSVVIEKKGYQEENDTPEYSLNRYFNDINPTDTIPGIRTGNATTISMFNTDTMNG